MRPALQRSVQLADAVTIRLLRRPPLPWMWGPGLLGWALARLQDRLGDNRYDEYLLRFCRAHATARIDSSDTAAPALLTHALAGRGHHEFDRLTSAGLQLVRTSPGLPGTPGVPNHLGTSGYARWYPASAWVDSLMMIGVFPAIVGADRGDTDLVAAAAAMPGRFARLLQDETTGLWAHSWWAPARHSPRGRRFPARVFWARGNGWVAASLPMLLAAIGTSHPGAAEVIRLNEQTALALAARQRLDGGWTTVLNGIGPSGLGCGRPETSAAALIAAGWLTSVRLGVLPDDYVGRARSALAAVLAAIVDRPGGPSLTGVSGPTIPVPVLPRLGYLAVPDLRDAPWGVAAVIFAALADDELG